MVVKRLKKHFDFIEMRNAPFKSFTHTFVLQMRPNSLQQTRFGYTVSKKISKLATSRNRLRRQMREIVRLSTNLIGKYPSHDFVLIARKDALEHTYKELSKDFEYLLAHMKSQENNEE